MRIALGVEYDGAKFCGWQRQNDVETVQEVLEAALSKVANHKVNVFCAGRTDTGVHGTGQVVHFETDSVRGERGWTLGVNTNLPDAVAVRWMKVVPDDFHARFSATARRYRYIIYNGKLRPGILNHGLSHYHMPLDEKKMHIAAQALLGENDFSSFRASQCQSKSPVRFMHFIKVTRHNEFIVIDIKANAFVHHMVRNIAGSLIAVGRGDKPIEWVGELLAVKDRRQAGETAKPNGLYLIEVEYPEIFDLPKSSAGPLFLPE
ncbi:tRNA pseudouridine(38-40) synthase TruA [Psychrosphaera sp. B3R10]|uniref:tRNA pseudouridine(38-40) synthase TruA n=1 Tax=unclassified Psychrosphaera TaxID=2641570 RepID=UPI001C08A60F|nr:MULTISPECIES: tRNA pseudouridine(38-40) synthase TruA [unclassified Psychrosphaera]MBU2880917.1 tRNA pseudouridine(38-40) synthase TruA [Psychrosphaera sp. I2R16]MBU2990864.1 tRNA pseudouridine(38-40) synthase TruA [Psychrosphaera sp. B3R10]MDO6720560.1 tRNA pseudouridine(38-40) synthase TruA [Psychrosphaera sp. 1_MG-2023]